MVRLATAATALALGALIILVGLGEGGANSGGDGEDQAAPSSDGSECVDDSEALGDMIFTYLPVPEFARDLLTCSIIRMLVSDSSNREIQAILGILASYGVEDFNCVVRIQDVCRQHSTDSALCESAGNLTLRDTCCVACSGWVESDKYHFGTQVYRDEGESFVKLLEGLGLLDTWDPPLDLCTFRSEDERAFVHCESESYKVFLQMDSLMPSISVVSPAIGELKRMRVFRLEGNGAGLPNGPIPQEIGGCTRLEELEISGTGLTGGLPLTMTSLTRLVRFSVYANRQLGGNLGRDFFGQWPSVKIIQISDSGFIGEFPILNCTRTPKLEIVDARNNGFIDLSGLVWPEVPLSEEGVSLDFADNNFTAIPDALRSFQGLRHLSLSGNQISRFPLWGNYFGEFFGDVVVRQLLKGVLYKELSLYKCWWKNVSQGIEEDRAPARWPLLRSVVLSNNPLNIPLQQFLLVMGQAPAITELFCVGCGLYGNLTYADEHGVALAYRFHEEGEMCTVKKMFSGLQTLVLSNNAGIDGCEFVSAGSVTVSGFWGPLQMDFNCGRCPIRQRVPATALKSVPLPSIKDCECQETFETHYTEKFQKECGCKSHDYFDPILQTCRACADEFLCTWDNTSEAASLKYPLVKAGAWMPCQASGLGLPLGDLYHCVSTETCVGGRIEGEACTDGALCGSGRTGIACSQCQPGFYGGPDGECSKCSKSPETARRGLAVLGIGSVPACLAFMLLFGRSDARMSNIAKLRPLRAIMVQLLKHVQLLTIVARLDVSWPKAVQEFWNIIVAVSLDIAVFFQVGCAMEEQTSELALLSGLTMPLVGLCIVVAASLLSHPLASLCGRLPSERCRKLAPRLKITFDRFAIFVFMLWSIYFSVFLQVSLEVMTCRKHPNELTTIARYPDVRCGEGRWWPLMIASVVGFLLYVVAYFAISAQAVISIGASLAASGHRERGPFGFAADGLRDTWIFFNMCTAAKDVALNVAIVISANDVTGQLLLTAGITSAYAAFAFRHQPFDTWSTNFLEVWYSVGLATLLVLAAGLGFQGRESSFQDVEEGAIGDIVQESMGGGGEAPSKGVWLSLVLIGQVCLPVCLMIYELLLSVPYVVRLVPSRFLPLHEQRLSAWAEEVQSDLKDVDMHGCISVMDAVELKGLIRIYGGGASAHQGQDDDLEQGPVRSTSTSSRLSGLAVAARWTSTKSEGKGVQRLPFQRTLSEEIGNLFRSRSSKSSELDRALSGCVAEDEAKSEADGVRSAADGPSQRSSKSRELDRALTGCAAEDEAKAEADGVRSAADGQSQKGSKSRELDRALSGCAAEDEAKAEAESAADGQLQMSDESGTSMFSI